MKTGSGSVVGAALAVTLMLGVFSLFAPAITVSGQSEPASQLGSVGTIVGAPSGTAVSGAELERRTTEVARLLRCPVCQGLSIADSHAAMAVNMKNEVRELLARGYSTDQILDYFEASYGEFVRLEPRKKGFNYVVWIAPALALLLGGGVIAMVLKSQKRRSAAAPESTRSADALEIAPELEPWILRVREVAYGTPSEDSSTPSLEEKA